MTLRAAGFMAAAPEAAHAFARAMTAAFEARGLRAHTVLEPADRPVLALVFARDRALPVTLSRAPNGDLALTDGEIVSGPGALDAGHAVRDAAAMIVVWRASTHTVEVVRDAAGQVPVLWAERPEGVYFASGMAAFPAAGVPMTPDPATLDFFLARGFAPAPWTFVREVRKVPPGCLLRLRQGRSPSIERYEPVPLRGDVLPQAERIRRIGPILADAVARCGAPEPAGVLLSGGVDSALILAVAARELGGRLSAFTFRYEDYDGAYNEEQRAREAADLVGARHEIVPVRPQETAARLAELIDGYGEPFTYGLHSFALTALKDAGIRSVLTGVGSDQFGITPIDRAMVRFAQLPAPARAAAHAAWPWFEGAVAAASPKAAMRAGQLLWADSRGVPARCAVAATPEEIRRRLYTEDKAWPGIDAATRALYRATLADMDDRPMLDRARFLSQRFFAAECMLAWNTAWARAFDLPIRHPFLARDLQTLMMRTETDRSGKDDLRLYAEQLLPPGIARRPKLHHTIPVSAWLRGPLRAFMEDELAPVRLKAQGVFDPKTVDRLKAEHVACRADRGWTLWSLIAYGVWLRGLSPAVRRRAAA